MDAARLDATHCLQLHHLRREVLAARDRGRVAIEFADGIIVEDLAEARQVADGMISLMNIPVLGPHWFPVDRMKAAAIVMAVLHWDLETFRPRVPERQAAELAGKIFGHFPDDAVFLTNVRPSANMTLSPHKWASRSELEELDAGVCIISRVLVGLVWIEERP